MTRPEEPPAPATAADPRGLELHARLVAGDLQASQDIWGYYDALIRAALHKLMKPSPHNEDVAHEYAQRAIVRLIESPERFDPSRNKSLYGYLRMDVEGDVVNYVNSSRYRTRIDSIDKPVASTDDAVGEQTLAGNLPSDDPMPDELVIAREGSETVMMIRQKVVETREEAIVFDLQYIHAERSTDVFAGQLDIAHLPTREQVRDIQKIKDRLAKRLRRMREDQL
jgi:DNA-directed RNA polymerase specialized sigma subunit